MSFSNILKGRSCCCCCCSCTFFFLKVRFCCSLKLRFCFTLKFFFFFLTGILFYFFKKLGFCFISQLRFWFSLILRFVFFFFFWKWDSIFSESEIVFQIDVMFYFKTEILKFFFPKVRFCYTSNWESVLFFSKKIWLILKLRLCLISKFRFSSFLNWDWPHGPPKSDILIL